MIRFAKDRTFVEEVKHRLDENDGYCPCRTIKNPDTKCMCKDFRDQIKRGIEGSCACGLYVYESDFTCKTRTPEQIRIKYHKKELKRIEKLDIGDWIDLRAAEDVVMEAGEFRLISLGVSMKLPDGYEAHIVPRSSTFGKWGIIQTNHMGVIDNAYSGDGDIWKFPAYAVRDTYIGVNDRICQFRIMKKQPDIEFIETEQLDETNRGGFGSSGSD